ncbi:MAG TPA: peptidoglycan-binding protein [Stellaceae bacterium]|jgi:peptidoglycan hydrolase-like protein with peptidoglycan-binding domain
MRTLFLATASAIALGLAGVAPGYAAQNPETNPGPAVTQPATPATPNAQSAMPQTGDTGSQPATSTMGSSAQSNEPATANPSTSMNAAQATPSEVRQAQEKLRGEGIYHGRIDGMMGPETQQALRQYQQKNGLQATATLDQKTMNSLLGPAAGQGSSMPGTTPPSSGAGTAGSGATNWNNTNPTNSNK